MFKHILIAIDGSDCAGSALDMAIDLAKGQGAKLTIINVVDVAKAALASMDPYGGTAVPMLQALTDEGKELLLKAARRASAAGVPAETDVLTGSTTAEQIDGAAVRLGCDLIVVGSHGRSGFTRLALGSVAEGVMRGATVPTLIVHARKDAPVAASAHG